MKLAVKILSILTAISFAFIPGFFKVLTMILFIIPFVLFPFIFGFDDGWMKKHKTEHHIAKYPLFLCLAYFVIIGFHPMVLIGWLLMYKPLFDYGWSFGNGKKKLFIGTTAWEDRVIRKLGLFKERSFSWIVPIYFFSSFMGYCLIMHYSRGMYDVAVEYVRGVLF